MPTVAKTQELPVMEAFYTLQGEGFHSGKAAYFVRLGGCDVGCHWCDVKESWDPDQHPQASINKIVDGAMGYPVGIAVITGGEPLMYPLNDLCLYLKQEGFRTHLETSGVYPVTGKWDWICFSPKKFKPPLQDIYNLAHELKVVIYHPSDFLWAEQHAEGINEDCRLFLQPEWSKADKVTPLIVDYIRSNPKWQISLQTHKYLNIP